jgi:uncharacterized protein (TIGR02118 family)
MDVELIMFDRRDALKAGIAVAAAGAATGGARAEEAMPTSGLFGAVYLVKRKEGMSFEDFRRHQTEVHRPLAHALPGLRHYRLFFFPPVDGKDQPYDSAAIVYFDNKADHDAALSSPEGQRALADLPTYQDMSAFLGVYGEEVYDGPPQVGA